MQQRYYLFLARTLIDPRLEISVIAAQFAIQNAQFATQNAQFATQNAHFAIHKLTN